MSGHENKTLHSLKELLEKIRKREIYPDGKYMKNIPLWNDCVARAYEVVEILCKCEAEFPPEIQKPLKEYEEKLTYIVAGKTALDDDSTGDILYMLSRLEGGVTNHVIYPALQSFYKLPGASSILESIIKRWRKRKTLKYPFDKYMNVGYDPERKRLFLKCQKVMKCFDDVQEEEKDKPSFEFIEELNTEWWEAMVNEHNFLIPFLKERLEKIRKVKSWSEKEDLFYDMLQELWSVRNKYPEAEDDLPRFL